MKKFKNMLIASLIAGIATATILSIFAIFNKVGTSEIPALNWLLGLGKGSINDWWAVVTIPVCTFLLMGMHYSISALTKTCSNLRLAPSTLAGIGLLGLFIEGPIIAPLAVIAIILLPLFPPLIAIVAIF